VLDVSHGIASAPCPRPHHLNKEIKITAYSFGIRFDSEIFIHLFSKHFLDGEHEEQQLQRSGQQCQPQQPTDGAAPGHAKSADASNALDTKPTSTEPPDLALTTTTTTTTSV
jgi:hypothetical protein